MLPADRQIQLVLHGRVHSGDELAGIADDGDDDQADESAADVACLDDPVDAVDHGI